MMALVPPLVFSKFYFQQILFLGLYLSARLFLFCKGVGAYVCVFALQEDQALLEQTKAAFLMVYWTVTNQREAIIRAQEKEQQLTDRSRQDLTMIVDRPDHLQRREKSWPQALRAPKGLGNGAFFAPGSKSKNQKAKLRKCRNVLIF